MSEEGKRKKRDKDEEDSDESFTSSLRALLLSAQRGQKSTGEKWDWTERKT